MFTEQSIPPELDAAVLMCLSKHPRERPVSAERLWALLDATGLADRWDQSRARDWWELHEPELVSQI